MKQRQRIVILGLALLLVDVPTMALAQTSPPSGAASQPSPSPSAGSPPRQPSTNPLPAGAPRTGSSNVSGSGGQASPAMPVIEADCHDNDWKKFGFASESACISSLTSGKSR
jgi:hypothetical protein